jgi:hypothetical protein
MVPVGGLEPPRPKATDFESQYYGFQWDIRTTNALLQLVLTLSGSGRFWSVFAKFTPRF